MAFSNQAAHLSLLCLWPLAGLVCQAQVADREAVVPRISDAIVIDGRLDDGSWANAAVLRDFFFVRGDKTVPSAQPVEARLAYDGEALFVGITAFEEDLSHLIAKFLPGGDESSKQWWDDGFEVFVSPSRRPNHFYLFMVNVANSRCDFGITPAAKFQGIQWDSGFASAVRREADRWVLEIRIPFEPMHRAPALGECWLFNVVKVDFDRRKNPAGGLRHCFPGWAGAQRKFGRIYFGRKSVRTDDASLKKRKKITFDWKHNLDELFERRAWLKPWDRLMTDNVSESERVIYRDSGTGAEVWLLTSGPSDDSLGYAHWAAHNADGSRIRFYSYTRPGINSRHYWMRSDGAEMQTFERLTGFQSSRIPRWHESAPDTIYAARKSPAPAAWLKVNLRTGTQETIAEYPAGYSRPVMSSDRKWLVAWKGLRALVLLNVESGEARTLPLKTVSTRPELDKLHEAIFYKYNDEVMIGYQINHAQQGNKANPAQYWLLSLDGKRGLLAPNEAPQYGLPGKLEDFWLVFPLGRIVPHREGHWAGRPDGRYMSCLSGGNVLVFDLSSGLRKRGQWLRDSGLKSRFLGHVQGADHSDWPNLDPCLYFLASSVRQEAFNGGPMYLVRTDDCSINRLAFSMGHGAVYQSYSSVQ